MVTGLLPHELDRLMEELDAEVVAEAEAILDCAQARFLAYLRSTNRSD